MVIIFDISMYPISSLRAYYGMPNCCDAANLMLLEREVSHIKTVNVQRRWAQRRRSVAQ